jgi:threonine aldolase
MGNLVSAAAQTRPGDEVIADSQAHIVINEAGGAAAVAGVQLRLLDSDEGVPDAATVGAAVRDANVHFPVSRLLCLENTHNRHGGAAIDAQRIRQASDAAHQRSLRVHCDGARIFNAAVALGVPAAELVGTCDSVSVCFSKGLGAPVGSAIAGDAGFIDEARRWRKRLGGGMRQAGIIAAAAIYALEHNVDRLAEDHANAATMTSVLRGAGLRTLLPRVPTNLVVLETPGPAPLLAAQLAADGVLVSVVGPTSLRCVTHLDVTALQCRRAAEVIAAAAGVSAAR